MSGSPQRRRARHEEDISGQFRVTVPDAGELDQLRTRGGVYRRGLYTASNRDNAPPERTRSLPASSRESSTELMDTDDARRASEEIYRRIRQQAGLSRSGLVGDVTLHPEPLGVMTQGRLVLRRRTSKQPQVGQLDVRDQPVGDPNTTGGAIGGVTLLNIPPCSMAKEPGEHSQSLFRPPMSDPELDLECQRGARPKVAGPLTTQTIQEEAKAASTEERALQLRGTDFYLPLVGQPRISERKSWRAPIVTEQGNPGIYVQIDEWLPLYKGIIYVVDEIFGRMYLSKGEHLMQIAETASHRPFQDHELSMSRHVPEREHPSQEGQEPPSGTEPEIAGEGRGDMDPLTPMTGLVGGIGRTPIPVAESTRHPGERPLTPAGKHERKRPDQRDEFSAHAPGQGGITEEARGDHQGGNPNGHCLNPQTHVDPQEKRWEKRGCPLKTLRGEMKAPSSRNILSLIGN